jgi:hypothetical protein
MGNHLPSQLAPGLLAVLALALTGCTEAALFGSREKSKPPVDNRLAVSGDFCTEDPSKVEFPVKILFVVDVSQSMSQTDPPDPTQGNLSERTRAVDGVITSLAGQQGVEIGIISFQSSSNDETGGFVPIRVPADSPDPPNTNLEKLITAAARLQSQNGQTNYDGALNNALQVTLADIIAADEKVRARSKYVVIFVSDGLPNPIDPITGANSDKNILEQVGDLKALERDRRLGRLELHTVYLSGRTPPQFQAAPIRLLQDMAKLGGGTFRNIGNGERINFLDIDFTSFRRQLTLKSFLAFGANARPIPDLLLATDSDGDSLSDADEDRIGTDPGNPDTDGDGVNDYLEDRLRNAGFDPLDGTDADCAVTATDHYNRDDDDGDGLRNCEERYLGTNPRLYDSDADGFPDYVEMSLRSSAVEDDSAADGDRDTELTGFEIRDHTDPLRDDRAEASRIRYVYDLVRTGTNEGRTCYTFTVDNVQLEPTLATVTAPEGRNDVYVIFGQVPQDAPDDFGEFRIACVRGFLYYDRDVKLPAGGHIHLTAQNFKKPMPAGGDPADPELFVPDRDCVGP